MEKTCEFCMSMSPIVYCKADMAHLCLCCDAKIHSANALSFRHPRTLACESCRYQPAHVRCLNHGMFMCHSCDANSHVSFHHQKKVIGCYVGCPSAEDLAELWGFESSVLEVEWGSSNLGSSKVFKGSLILQQIKELQNLQLAEGIQSSTAEKLPFRHDRMQKINGLECFDGNLDFQNPNLENGDEERLGSPFSQLEQAGESSFWQYKTSPVLNNEIWLQNMQDLGVCDEVRCFDDDVHIPDVDMTFRSFEELFGNEKINEDVITEQANVTIDETKLSGQAQNLADDGSVSSLSISRITNESSGSECKDDVLSPAFHRRQIHSDKKKVSRHEKQSQYSFSRSKSDVKKRVKTQALKIESVARGGCESSANVITQSF